MLLGFLSFWFAAPEFIGEQRLRAWERALVAGVLRLPKGLQWLLAVVNASAVTAYLIWKFVYRAIPDYILLFPVLTVSVLMLMYLSQIFVEPIVSRLANDSRVRQRALFVGAVLFTLSFLLQFVASFVS